MAFKWKDLLLDCLRVFIITGLKASALGSDVAKWVAEPSVQNLQVTSGRLSTINVNTLQNCIVECYVQPECVTVGFSGSHTGCQLYDIDLADFAENIITQPETLFYKAVCSVPGYTHVRSLGLCVKRVSTNQLPMANASATCQHDGGSLMTVDITNKGDYLRDILFHIHADDFEYLIGGQWDQATEAWTWMDGTPIDGNSGAVYWLSTVPDDTNGECLAIHNFEGSIAFEAVACETIMMFLCSYGFI